MSDSLKGLLEAAQAAEQPASEVVERGWASLDQQLQAGAGPSVPVDVRGLPGFSKAALPLLAKIALVATVAGGVAVGVVASSDREPARPLQGTTVGQVAIPMPAKPRRAPQAQPVAPAPDPVAPPPEPATPAPAVVPVTPTPARTTRPAKKAPTPAAAPAPSRLSEETALLRKAWRALDQGRSVAAATAIAAHERDFPKGALQEEREAVRAVLGCQRDQDAAAQIASRFAKRFPKSVHRARVRRTCTEEKK